MPRALLQSHSGFMNCEHISDHVASSNLLSRIVFQGKLHPISKIILNQVALATMGTALFVGPNALQGAFCSFGVLARKSTWVVIFIEGRLRLEELPLNVISFDFISFIYIYIYTYIYIHFIHFIPSHFISFAIAYFSFRMDNHEVSSQQKKHIWGVRTNIIFLCAVRSRRYLGIRQRCALCGSDVALWKADPPSSGEPGVGVLFLVGRRDSRVAL